MSPTPQPAPSRKPTRAVPTGSQDAMQRLFSRILREVLVATAAITVLGFVVGYLVSGLSGLLGAVLGVGAAVLFSTITVLTMRAVVGKPPTTIAAVVLGTWLAKMIVLVVALAVLADQTFYDKYVFATVLFAVVIASMVVDVRAVMQARIPNADPPADTGAGSA